MSREHQILIKWAELTYPGVEYELLGNNKIQINEAIYTLNLYCDIMRVRDNGKCKIVYKSDLRHDIRNQETRIPEQWHVVKPKARDEWDR